jgi:hypothetical protein
MNTELPQVLREVMEKGYSEVDIAARFRVSQSTVRSWRLGNRTPALPHLVLAELRRMLAEKS